MAKEKTMKFKILALAANDKATEWAIKIKSPFGITEAKCQYAIKIEVDDAYFAERVSEIERKIKDVEAKPDMFDDYKATIKSLNENIKGIEADKKAFSELEIDEFSATCTVADFSKDTLVLEIPEQVVPEIIKLRHDVEAFVVALR